MNRDELLALMAAAIYPHVDDYGSMKRGEQIAIDRAEDLLTEIELRAFKRGQEAVEAARRLTVHTEEGKNRVG